MSELLKIVISLILSAGLVFNNLSVDDQITVLKPFIYMLTVDDRRESKLVIEKAEGQFFDHNTVFEKSAAILNGLHDITIMLDPRDAGRRKVRNSMELSDGRILYVAANRELSKEIMDFTIAPEVTDVFSKTDVIEITIDSAYIIYWWEIPGPFSSGGIIYLINHDQLESWYIVRRNLSENWVSFFYRSL